MGFCNEINLKTGSKGSKVLIAQKWLKYHKFYDGKLDGVFGHYTEKAVLLYQSKHGFKRDGVINQELCKDMGLGSLNCEKILLKNGSDGYSVYIVQWYLKKEGYLNTKIDGNYGNNTTAIVKDFQKKNKLAVDGIFGPETCRKLLRIKDEPVQKPATEKTKVETKTTILKHDAHGRAQTVSTVETDTSKKIVAPSKPVSPYSGKIKAYWVWGKDIQNIDVKTIRSWGITDLFVLTNRFGGDYYYKTFLPKVIVKFKGEPRVHAWVMCFKDSKGKWVNPSDTKFQNNLLNIISDISSIPGLSGIHLDYIRYPGNANGKTEHITNFVSKVNEKIGDKILSAALMPERENNAKYYGQDYSQLKKYLTWLCPMIYKGNYNANTAWIGKTVAYINSKAQNKVIAGLQAYESDENPVKLSELELYSDINMAFEYGAKGFAIFRWGLSNYKGAIDPKKVEKPVKPKSGWQRINYYRFDYQDTNWTCGPSSSVMALSEVGVYAGEREMSNHQSTVVREGTSPGNLCYGIVRQGKEHNVKLKCWLQKFSDTGWQNLGDMIQNPKIAVIAHGKTGGWRKYWNGNWGHYVFPIGINVSKGLIEIADPKKGKLVYKLSEFKKGLDMVSSPSLIIVKKD